MSNLTALVLAAGYGSRIADITTDPKSLLKVCGKPLMEWHLESLKKVGIKKLVVVTGYKKEMLENFLDQYKNDFEITFAINEDYRVKGNTYSMLFGLEKIEGAFLLFDADLIYDTEILRSFVEDKTENQILVGDSSIDDIECSKAMIDRDGYVRMTIDKRAVTAEENTKYQFVGEAIGILKFSKQYRDEMFDACKEFLAKPENVSKNWEHVMNEFLLTHDMSVQKCINNRWVEIDNKEDLEKAKGIFE